MLQQGVGREQGREVANKLHLFIGPLEQWLDQQIDRRLVRTFFLALAAIVRLRQRHSGPLGVIWDNAPAHRGEAVREYLRTPGLGLRLMNPRFHEGRLCRATARTEAPMRPSGAGRERKPPETCAWEPRPW